MKTSTTVKKLHRLHGLLRDYRFAYYRAIDANRGLSSRMYGWIDEYNSYRHSEAWKVYCEQTGSDLSHDALDIFA